MPRDALIGHTGFVGSNLSRQHSFAAVFNSANSHAMRGQHFTTVICAGAPGAKWIANKEPARDLGALAALRYNLSQVVADNFVLISTIDVYPESSGRSEDDIPDRNALHPYGLHRLDLEDFVSQHFPSHSIVRLPALFGVGLKKNALFDLLNCNQTERIAPNAEFQWYPLRRLAGDLARIRAAGLRLCNITAPPMLMSSIHRRFFPTVPLGPELDNPPRYDLRTKYAHLLGGDAGYMLRADEVLEEMADFIASVQRDDR